MKKIILRVVLFCTCLSVLAQKKQNVLVTINDEKITVAEFKRIYEKNLDAIEDEESKDVKNNLELYINYKLKVADAYAIKLDTLASYKTEIETYKNQLIAPYLQDTLFLKKLMKEAYYRTANEIKASHILVKLNEDAAPKDTLIAYNKIMDARNKILNGENFSDVAKLVSEDPSAVENAGDLGYFGAFKMVYPFEEAAYNTKINAISMPFRTQFGYHIVQPNASRKSKGDVEVAHIYIADKTDAGRFKIDSVYAKLTAGESFEELVLKYSDDNGSKNNGGKLQKFGAGRMVKPFEDGAYALESVGDFTAPINTRFGWHILKLINKHPIQTYEEMQADIENQLRRSGRAKLSDDAVINRLKKEYKIIENKNAMKILAQNNARAISTDSLQETLFTINEKEIKQALFANYIKNRRQFSIEKLYEMFKEQEIKNYFKENLIYTEPEYAATLTEYKDGLLLFELMQQNIWEKSSKDSLGLQQFFQDNKQMYATDSLSVIKGKVINDYQNFLEDQWIANLKAKNKIEINKRALKKLIEFYEKKK